MSRIRCLLAAALLIHLTAARAEEFPVKPVRWIVPQVPGGASDTLARVIGQKIGDQWGRQIVIDNRVGANGIIGTEIVAKSAADGYTWLVAYVGTHATNPALYRKLPYDTNKDLTAVATLGTLPFVLIVGNGLPAAGLQELIALAKQQPGKLNYGAPNGSVNHLLGVMVNAAAGVNMLFVPYRSPTDALTDTVGGRIQLAYSSAALAMPFVRAGKARVLAVSAARRSNALPEVPTIAESGVPGFDVNPWFGLFVRAGTAAPVVRKINSTVNNLLTQKDIIERFALVGAEPLINTPEQFAKIARDDIVKWAKVVKDAGVAVE